MTTKYGFNQMTISELEAWLPAQRVARTILFIQQHHTYSPDYSKFTGSNHFELQKNMKEYHVNHNGWADLGQHFTTFPDGTVLTGRSLELSPAGIYMNNAHAICLEHLGDFDAGNDQMTAQQRDTIIRVTAALCGRFGVPVSTDRIVYHHWFNLDTGVRNNGTGNNKTCPGTRFFSGNKVADCQAVFLPAVTAAMGGAVNPVIQPGMAKYVCVTAGTLNIRERPEGSGPLAADRDPATLGSILRVFDTQNGWHKVSASREHWISAKYTIDVSRATVNADVLNVRSGPGTSFPVVASLITGQELFISGEQNGWCKISMDEKWVKKEFLSF
jgi:hypothetical protein